MSECPMHQSLVEREPASLDRALKIDSYAAAELALRSTDLVQGLWDSPAARLVHHAVTDLDFAPHLERRRLENAMFRKEAFEHYETQVLMPALRKSLARICRQHPEAAHPRVDLMPIVRSALVCVAAALVGLEGIDTPEAAQTFWEAFSPVRRGLRINWNLSSESERRRVLGQSFAAQEEYARRYVQPAIQRKRALKESAESSTHPDLISLMLLRASPDWDEGQIMREVTTFLSAAMGTASYVSCRSFLELGQWLRQHPADESKLEDLAFLHKVINETARLYPPSPSVVRKAIRDTRILDHSVAEGEYVVIDIYHANRDTAAYGSDAAQFNPHRQVGGPARTQAFGLAFAGGPHMCIGKPLAVAARVPPDPENNAIGLVARVVRELLRAGVVLDPDREPVIGPPGMHEDDVFPVILVCRD